MLDADGLPIVERKLEVETPVSQRIVCESCGIEYGIGDSPWCRDSHQRGVSNWHFKQGQNDARREAFYAKRAADPFGD
jgi:hypothetical protein